MDYDWPAGVANLHKTRELWARLSRVKEGGSVPEKVGEILNFSHSGDTDLQYKDLGGKPPYGADPGGVTPLDGAANNGEAPKSMSGWGLAIIPDNGGAKGSRA